jgi:hypothetical protein
MYNMLTSGPYILPLSVHLLRHVLGTYPRFLWTWFMGEILMQMNKEQRMKLAISSRGSNNCTRHNIKLDMTSIGLIISSRLETGYGFTSTRINWRVKARKSSPFIMDPSLYWIKVVPMLFIWIFHLICVEEKIWIDLTQAFSDFTWLKKSRREYHPMFIANKNNILTHKY